ncbi:hypothetical protein BGY98DRAFT_1189693 [Russula aff. rugulosa BPL654]|nr:hypothetical protein BGY98DRAFT_1189693 [Russula aff. rugulosa BPL654]
MQKLLLAFVSVVTVMGLIAPSSSAFAMQDDAPTRRDGGNPPRPSHHFNHKRHDQSEQRGLFEPPSRRDGERPPRPSHHFNFKTNALPPLQFKTGGEPVRRDLFEPPTRRDGDRPPQPSHHFNHKTGGEPVRRDLSEPPTRRDGGRPPRPSHHFNHKTNGGEPVRRDLSEPPTRRDGDRPPKPSYHFNHKTGGEPVRRDLSEPPTRRDGDRPPKPSHHFNFKTHGGEPVRRDLSEPPTRRDGDRPPQPSHHFNHKTNGAPSGNGGGNAPSGRDLSEPPTRRDGDRPPQPSHHFNFKTHGPVRRDLSEFPPTRRDGDQGRKRQERNSDRLARGLPPLPPSRRGSARSPQPSHHFDHRIEIQDTNGNQLGYFTVNGQDLSVKYHPRTQSLSLDGNNFGGANFLGDSDPKTILASNSPTFVYFLNVDKQQANDDLWSLDGNNELTATRMNSDGTQVPIHFCLYNGGFVMTGSPSSLGCEEVYFYLSN